MIGTLVSGITTVDVVLDMGFEPNPEMMWSIGLLARKRWEQLYGAPPPKDLRQKTYDKGVHCFAIYPEHFRKEIEKIARAHQLEKARQGDLFDPRNPPEDRPSL